MPSSKNPPMISNDKAPVIDHRGTMRIRIGGIIRDVVKDPEMPERDAYDAMVSRLLVLFERELAAAVKKELEAQPRKLENEKRV